MAIHCSQELIIVHAFGVLCLRLFKKGEFPVENVVWTIWLLIQKMSEELTVFIISHSLKIISHVLDLGLFRKKLH